MAPLAGTQLGGLLFQNETDIHFWTEPQAFGTRKSEAMERVSPRPKLPKNYQLVYDVLCAQPEGHHASANEIHGAAKRLRPGLGYSTVYRALDRLHSLGLVLEVRLPGSASALYEPARAGHAHFHCVRCGRVDDIEFSLSKAELAALAARHRVEIGTVFTTLNGLCERCHAL